MRKFFLLFVFVVMVFSGCKCSDQKEIDNWDFGKQADKVCPLFGVYPVLVYSMLPRKYDRAVAAAIVRWNRASEKVGGGLLFQKYSKDALKMKPEGFKGRWPIVVYLRPAPKKMQCDEGTCAPIKLKAFSIAQDKGFAETSYKIAGGEYVGAMTYVCVEKYEKARLLQQTPIAQSVREGGMYRILLHELGHVIFGANHTTTYGDIMKKNPPNEHVDYHLEELLRQRIVAVCKKNGRFALWR